MFKSVVLKSTLAYAFIALISVSPLLFASYYLLEKRAGAELNKEFSQLLVERKNHILTYLELEASKVRQVTKGDFIGNSLKEYNSKKITLSDFRYKIEKELSSLLQADEGYRSLSIIDPQGMILASSNEQEVGKYMESIANGALENDFFIFSKDYQLIFVTPFVSNKESSADKENLAYLMLARDSKQLSQIIKNQSLGAEVFLGNSKSVFLPETDKQAWNPFFEKGILSKSSVYETYDDSKDTKVLVSTLSLGYKDWILATEIARQPMYASLLKYLGQIFAVAMICFALGVLLHFLFTRMLLSRLFELISVTNKINSGALYARASCNRNDELSILAASVNEIADTLEKEVFKRREQREKEATSLNALAEKSYGNILEKYQAKGVELELVLSDQELYSWVVSEELEEVLTKLLETSLTYSESNSMVVIRVCEDEKSNVSIVIKDWNGFSNEHREVYRDARAVIRDFGGSLEIHSKRGGVNSASLVFVQAEEQQQNLTVNS